MSYAINSFQQIHLYNGHKDSLFSKFYKYIFIRKIKKQIKGINKMRTLEKKLNVCHWHILTTRGNFDNFFTHHCRRWNIINWQMSTVQYYSLYMQVKSFLLFYLYIRYIFTQLNMVICQSIGLRTQNDFALHPKNVFGVFLVRRIMPSMYTVRGRVSCIWQFISYRNYFHMA